MSAYSVWESHFPPQEARAGRAVTEAIWRDMTRFDGYVAHELIEDLDDPGHLLVVSQWTTRERADATLRAYASHPNARHANELVSRPRTRFVGHAVPPAA
jgi:heme-degrading monooxygenase HmoA